MIDPAAPLACPLDGLALAVSGKVWRCENNHCYDMARAGYLNLLPVRYKPSRDPGDTRAMIDARRRVLDAGIFEPLADAVADRVASICSGHGDTSLPAAADDEAGVHDAVVVDAGCGEGYYTERLRQATLTANAVRTRIIGVDISRWAINAAARRYRDISWIVANNRGLPILQGRCSLITSLFGFETWAPWAALQRSGQQVLVAHAGPLHLIELRKAIYETVRIHAPAPDIAAREAGYERIGETSVTTCRPVPASELWADILAMTPHGHRAASNHVALPAMLADKPLTIDVHLRQYRRT